MSMTGPAMAQRIHNEMGFSGSVSSILIEWGNAIVFEIQTFAVLSHDPGLVTGQCPPGSPLVNGAATDGLISSLDGDRLAADVVSRVGFYTPYGITECLQHVCEEIVNHIITYSRTDFATSQITGSCTNTPLSPGALVNGAGTLGFLHSMIPSILAQAIADACFSGSVSSKLLQFCTGLIDYIHENAVATYSSGNVTGTCPAGGGALQNGAGANGTIA